MQHWQNSIQGYIQDESGGPSIARVAAKDCIRDYVLLDWPPESFPRLTRGQGWDVQIGGEARDEQGQPQEIKPDQIAVTRLRNRPHLTIFKLAEIIAEIRREVGKEPENAPRCLYCGTVLDNQPKGRDRLFCDNQGKCKQASHRQKQREARRATVLGEHTNLLETWKAQHIDGDLLILLQNILIDQGEEAARSATIAITAYVKAEQERAAQEQQEQSQARKVRRKRNK